MATQDEHTPSQSNTMEARQIRMGGIALRHLLVAAIVCLLASVILIFL